MCEYPLTSKYHYDGVSEVVCMAEGCGYRRGRWCGNELAEGEFEPPHHEGDTHPRVFDL